MRVRARSPRTALVAALLLLSLPAPAVVLAAAAPVDEERAEQAFEEGRRLFERRDAASLVRSLELFSQAAALDAEDARFHAAVAQAACLVGLYSLRPPPEIMPLASRAARRALELDADEPDALAALGLVTYLYDWSWEEAEALFRRAIAVDPGLANAHHWYAMLLVATGRADEAVERMRAGMRADPHSRIIQIKLGTVLIAADRDDEAERYLREVVDRFPDTALPRRELGSLYLHLERFAQAEEQYRAAARLGGGPSRSEGGLACALASQGKTEEARSVAAEMRHRAEREHVPALYLAVAHACLREDGEALDWLDRAFEQHDPGLVYLRTKPELGRLAASPRFSRILAALDFPSPRS